MLTAILVDAHSTATKHAYPDIAPLVFGDAPDIVRHQCTAGVARPIVFPLTVLIAQDTSFVSAEPQTTVLCRIATDDDVAGYTEPLLRKLFQGFQCIRVHLDDTTVVTTDPIVALLVFRDGVDITNGQTLEVRHRL